MKVQNLLFVIYSNYSNRLIKPIGTYMTDYYTPGDDVLEVAKVNFHQGNGIYAEQVVTTDFSSFVYNYLLTSDNDDATLKVTTRWFVIGKEDLRNGQVRVSLKRDLISDYFNDVVSADFMMERGNLDFGAVGAVADTRSPDPLIFIQEGQGYNQIKTSETLLTRFQDNEPAWIVGYIPKNISGYQSVEIPELGGGVTFGTNWGFTISKTTTRDNIDDAFNVIAMPYADCTIINTGLGGSTYQQSKDVSLAIMTALAANGLLYDLQLMPYLSGMGTNMTVNSSGNIEASSKCFLLANLNEVNHCSPLAYGIFKGKYPGEVEVTHSASSVTAVLPSDWTSGGTVAQVVFVNTSGNQNTDKWISYSSSGLISVGENRYAFASGTDYTYSGLTITFTNPAFAHTLLTMVDNGEGYFEFVYQYGTNPGNVKPVIVSLANSKETFSISGKSIASVAQSDIKKSRETDLYRIVSPNHDGIFEWSPAINYRISESGGVTAFSCDANDYEVAIDLKPFDPYIRVQPFFADPSVTYNQVGFYGYNNEDGRGLICGGDFSLTMVSSAWANYKLNNKTYASTFSREISTLEMTHQAQSERDIANIVTSAIVGGIGAGMATKNPIGAVVGVAAGLFTSGLTAAYNYDIREENINKTKAQYNMNLQAIQARPDTLTKVGPLDPDNKIWPYVEVYSATSEEKDLFDKKMAMTGMTAHKQTTIASQMTDTTIIYPRTFEGAQYQYFSGSIVQIGDATEATPQMIQEIDRELRMGLYFATSLF